MTNTPIRLCLDFAPLPTRNLQLRISDINKFDPFKILDIPESFIPQIIAGCMEYLAKHNRDGDGKLCDVDWSEIRPNTHFICSTKKNGDSVEILASLTLDGAAWHELYGPYTEEDDD